ncbi:hypothetical protein DRV85_17540, partial [Rhodosalinus halophilus]
MSEKGGLAGGATLAVGAATGALALVVGLYAAGVLSPERGREAPQADVAGAEPAPESPAAPQPDGVEDADATADAAPEPETAQTSAPAAEAETAAAEPPPTPAPPFAPNFDLVRVEPDGTAQIAGRAAPSAQVSILLDGEEVARAEADPSGAFFSFLDLAPSDRARVLSLEALQDGMPVPSEDQVILTPPETPREPQVA